MIYVGNFTEAMKNYVEEKLSKLQKLTESDEFTTVKVGKKNSVDNSVHGSKNHHNNSWECKSQDT